MEATKMKVNKETKIRLLDESVLKAVLNSIKNSTDSQGINPLSKEKVDETPIIRYETM